MTQWMDVKKCWTHITSLCVLFRMNIWTNSRNCFSIPWKELIPNNQSINIFVWTYIKIMLRLHWFFFFWASCWNHCLAALDIGAGVAQPFNCLIVQNRQAMQSMGRSMDWTLEDNVVNGLFFCATLTGRRGGHTPFVQAGVETSNTSAEVVKLDPGFSWEDHLGVDGCRCRPFSGCPSIPHSIGNPPTVLHVCCCCQMNWWDVRRVQMGVSILGAVHLHSMGRWALSGADVQAPWHGVLEIVLLQCDEAQKVGCLRGLVGCPLV